MISLFFFSLSTLAYFCRRCACFFFFSHASPLNWPYHWRTSEQSSFSRCCQAMAESSSSNKDFPASLVFEAVNSRVVVETVDGGLYRGKLVAYDTERGNIELTDVRHQARDSSYSFHERVTIKGSNVRIIQLPPEMKAAPSLQWRRDSVQQELKKSLKRTPVVRPRPRPVEPIRVKKAPFKMNKGKELRRKLR